jgi:hypothetical protein
MGSSAWMLIVSWLKRSTNAPIDPSDCLGMGLAHSGLTRRSWGIDGESGSLPNRAGPISARSRGGREGGSVKAELVGAGDSMGWWGTNVVREIREPNRAGFFFRCHPDDREFWMRGENVQRARGE